jgi:hypothetical protein
LEVADKLPKTSSSLSYGRGERAIQLAMKKELAVLGIETHDIRR